MVLSASNGDACDDITAAFALPIRLHQPQCLVRHRVPPGTSACVALACSPAAVLSLQTLVGNESAWERGEHRVPATVTLKVVVEQKSGRKFGDKELGYGLIRSLEDMTVHVEGAEFRIVRAQVESMSNSTED